METWLVPAEQRTLTPDRYTPSAHPSRVKPLEAIVYHYTVSRSASGSARWLSTKDASFVSAHFVIGLDGEVIQLAPLEDRTFHAGGPTAKLFGRFGVNERTIGIELVNLGPLTKTHMGLVDAYGRAVTREVRTFVDRKGQSWEAYPEAQIAALEDVVRRIIAFEPSLAARERHVGHEHVDPTRKRDPGPAFPWDRINALVGAPRA
jgi:N-acetylmuramoyl-L-alanine amidase